MRSPNHWTAWGFSPITFMHSAYPKETVLSVLANNLHRITEKGLVAQMVKHLSTMLETRFRPLGQEDPLEKGMATHSSILAWRIPWTEEPGGL